MPIAGSSLSNTLAFSQWRTELQNQ